MRVPCCVIAAIHFYFWILWLFLLLFFFFLLRVFFLLLPLVAFSFYCMRAFATKFIDRLSFIAIATKLYLHEIYDISFSLFGEVSERARLIWCLCVCLRVSKIHSLHRFNLFFRFPWRARPLSSIHHLYLAFCSKQCSLLSIQDLYVFIASDSVLQ